MSDKRINVENIVKDIKHLKPLTQNAFRILELISAGNYSFKQITSLMTTDGILTARFLSLVNSAAFSLSREITSLDEALPYLGENIILQIAVEHTTQNLMNKKLSGYLSDDENVFRENNIKTALAAKYLTAYSKTQTNPHVAFTSGLLHNIGKAVINTYLEQQHDIIFQRYKTENSEFTTAEKIVIGTDHCQAGNWIMRHWKLPAIFCDVALYHHTPSTCREESKAICYTIHLADILAMISGAGTSLDSMHYRLDQTYTNFFDADEKSFEKIIILMNEEYEKFNKVFSGSK